MNTGPQDGPGSVQAKSNWPRLALITLSALALPVSALTGEAL